MSPEFVDLVNSFKAKPSEEQESSEENNVEVVKEVPTPERKSRRKSKGAAGTSSRRTVRVGYYFTEEEKGILDRLYRVYVAVNGKASPGEFLVRMAEGYARKDAKMKKMLTMFDEE